MTDDIALDARNWLAQKPEVTALLGSDDIWETWIFANESPHRRIENTERCAIVIFVSDAWNSPNPHNTLSFPRMVVDVWADPTRAADNSIYEQDAKAKIQAVYKVVDKYFHTVDKASPTGGILQWGSAADIAANNGTKVFSSERLDGYPSISPVVDGNGALMGRIAYGLMV